MRGSGVHWPADAASEAANRTGGSRLLLDELLAERERAQLPPTPAPVLNVDPVAVPQSVETGRRALRHRLSELEAAARRNYRSAEEARRVLAAEHERLEQELNARTHAQQEAAALRREVERLSAEETRRGVQEKTRAERAARAEIAGELEHYREEHDRVVRELDMLRSSLSEHDSLLDEYVTRLREEQTLRAEMRIELDRAEAAQSLAERSLLRATENARHGAEDAMIRLATAEQELADVRSDRDRDAQQLAELTSGDGALARLTAQLEDRNAEIGRLGVRIADLSARIDASEDAAERAAAERRDALSLRDEAHARLEEAVAARAEADAAADSGRARIAELETELAERIRTTDERIRELDLTLGHLRSSAREGTKARQAAEEQLATALSERDAALGHVAALTAERDRLCTDVHQLRAHAAALGDELAVTRAALTELQQLAASGAEPAAPAVVEDAIGEPAPQPAPVLEPGPETAAAPAAGFEAAGEAADAEPSGTPGHEQSLPSPPPLPLRIAGQHAPAPPLARRRRRPDAAPATVPEWRRREPEPEAAPVTLAAPPAGLVAEVPVPAAGPEVAEPDVAEPEVAEPELAGPEVAGPEVAEPAVGGGAAPAPAAASEVLDRRSALAEFSALATSGDDFTFRRR